MESHFAHVLKFFRKSVKPQRGFTLLELLVVVAIVGILVAAILLGQNNFSRSLILTDTAYSIALSIRQMQTYGLSSHTSTNGSTSFYNAGFGLYFSASNSYIQFADVYNGSPPVATITWCPTGAAGTPDAKPGNCIYNSANGEQLRSFSMQRGYAITNICGYTGSATVCTGSGNLTSLDMVFERPNTQSILTGVNGSIYTPLVDACIQVSSPDRTTSRWINVTQLGEVTVSNGTNLCGA